jgi:hypothetical protein
MLPLASMTVEGGIDHAVAIQILVEAELGPLDRCARSGLHAAIQNAIAAAVGIPYLIGAGQIKGDFVSG